MPPQYSIEVLGSGKYIKVRVNCPNCGRVKTARKIRSDQLYEERDIKCKCGITGFDWEFKPKQVGGTYVYINACASISANDMESVTVSNDRFKLSNH